MKNKNVVALILIGAVLVSSTAAVAFPGRGPKKGRMIEKIAQKLDLTETQKETFKAGAEAVEEENKALREANKDWYEKIAKEMKKDEPDKMTIYGYLEQISNNTTQIHFKRVEHILEFRKELTPEQKEKLKEIGAKGPRDKSARRRKD